MINIALEAVKVMEEGSAALVEDIGQGFMDQIQTPEGIATVAGEFTGGFVGGWAGAKIKPKIKAKVDELKTSVKGTGGAKKSVEINNPVLENVRTGSALPSDAHHAFNDIIDNYAGDATKFTLKGGDGVNRSLYQVEGSLNGREGVFEWIVDPDPTKGVTHRRFIENVGITGKPNARP